jgi:hypothetical protein
MTGGLFGVLLLSSHAGRGTPGPANGPFDVRLRAIAKDYLAWGRVDGEARLAPTDCRAPVPAEARVSRSEDAKTHGQKLYSLFAKDRTAYLGAAKVPNPVGQIVVKQSWLPIEVPDDGGPLRAKAVQADGGRFIPLIRKDGKLLKAGKQADLFVMFKLDPQTPGTDQGWAYGTVTPDGTRVTSAGRVGSCMRCHAKADHDRLFGLPGGSK